MQVQRQVQQCQDIKAGTNAMMMVVMRTKTIRIRMKEINSNNMAEGAAMVRDEGIAEVLVATKANPGCILSLRDGNQV